MWWHNKRYTRDKGGVEWGEWTPVPSRCASFHHLKALCGHQVAPVQSVGNDPNWDNVLIFDKLIFLPFNTLKIRINHIGFHVGL